MLTGSGIELNDYVELADIIVWVMDRNSRNVWSWSSTSETDALPVEDFTLTLSDIFYKVSNALVLVVLQCISCR